MESAKNLGGLMEAVNRMKDEGGTPNVEGIASAFYSSEYDEKHPLRLVGRGSVRQWQVDGVTRDRILFQRERLGMTQEQLAQRIGVSLSTIKKRLKEPANFKSGEVRALCDVFGVSVNYLRGLDDIHSDLPEGGPLEADHMRALYEHHLTDEQRALISSMVVHLVSANRAKASNRQLFKAIIAESVKPV